MKLEFEWHNAKAAANIRAHGVSFDLAKTAFSDPFAIERLDDRADYGEERFVMIAWPRETFCYLWPIPNARNASALFQLEGQPNMSKRTTSKKTLRPMTPEAIEAAARADSDAQPLTSRDLKRMKRTPPAKIIRRALGLTQEEFAAHYHIPLGTLRDWEQGRAEPDQPTQAYLKVIAREPERVERLLNPRPH
jgi:putative transcriptional regulator